MKQDERFGHAAGMLGERVRQVLERIPPGIGGTVSEIRLRVGQPLGLTASAHPLFVDERGGVFSQPPADGFRIRRQDLQDCLVSLCGWAVHSHQREMASGYISVKGGHRAGVAATAVVEEGKLTAVRDVTSINLRVAREIFGAADPIIKKGLADPFGGILLVGAPASGKTTLLRDLARQLSEGETGRYVKVCVVDESGEIGGASGGEVGNRLGPCCDLLSGYPKAEGMRTAIRYLSPQVIICDEVSAADEVLAVAEAVNSGVSVVTSIHAGSFEELFRKPNYRRLAHRCVPAGGSAGRGGQTLSYSGSQEDGKMMQTLLKAGGMVLILFCTTSIGMALARELSRRVEQLETAVTMLDAFEGELSYSLSPPDEIAGRLEQRDSLSDAAYLPLCSSLCRQGVPFPEAWKQAVTHQPGSLS